MAKINVFEELMTATGIKAKKNEEAGALAVRVATFISDKLSEEDYAKLSAPAQKWYEKALEAAEAEEELPAIPGAPAEEEGAEEEAAPTKKAVAKKAPAKKAAAKKEAPAKKAAAKKAPAKKAAAKKEPAKKAAAKKEPKEKAEPRASGSDYLRALLCKNPKLTKEQAAAKLEEKGLELAEVQINQVFRQTVRVLEILQEMGKL